MISRCTPYRALYTGRPIIELGCVFASCVVLHASEKKRPNERIRDRAHLRMCVVDVPFPSSAAATKKARQLAGRVRKLLSLLFAGIAERHLMPGIAFAGRRVENAAAFAFVEQDAESPVPVAAVGIPHCRLTVLCAHGMSHCPFGQPAFGNRVGRHT